MARGIAAGATLLATVFLHGCGNESSPSPSPSPPGPSPPAPSPPGPSPPGPNPPAPSPSPDGPSPSPSPPSPSPRKCEARPAKPDVPQHVEDLNGHEYPEACYELKSENHFFVIGDWGGMCGWSADNACDGQKRWADQTGEWGSDAPRPMHNRHGDYQPGIDDDAQQRVAASMAVIAEQTPPEFVVSVGDHFYPGGIAEEYNGDVSSYDFSQVPSQFKSTFEDIYNSAHMAEAEWMGVLGNHDYGGVCVKQGWPQQIYYTWNEVNKRWVMPAQYYSRSLRFSKDGSDDYDDEDFTVDMFFLDSNNCDAHAWNTAQDEDPVAKGHNICGQGNSDETYHCNAFFGPDNTAGGLWSGEDDAVDNKHCIDVFETLWSDQVDWLERLLDKSTADWQMIVTHFPPSDAGIRDDLMRLSETYGVDLIITGHSHLQTIQYNQPFAPGVDYGDTACIISGGGGGITSEGHPDEDGHDNQYGFMDLVLTKDKLTINPYSWGKTEDGSQWMMPRVEVSRRPRADLKDVRPVEPKPVVLV